MDLGIAGKTAIVCAGSRGLGRGCAEALAAAGVKIVLNGRNAETLAKTAAEMRATGAEVVEVAADITTEEGRAAVLAARGTDAPIHFIFHSAFCLSSVLARAFDMPGTSMGLKEPMLFNDLAGWQMRGAKGPQLAQAMDAPYRALPHAGAAELSAAVRALPRAPR